MLTLDLFHKVFRFLKPCEKIWMQAAHLQMQFEFFIIVMVFVGVLCLINLIFLSFPGCRSNSACQAKCRKLLHCCSNDADENSNQISRSAPGSPRIAKRFPIRTFAKCRRTHEPGHNHTVECSYGGSNPINARVERGCEWSHDEIETLQTLGFVRSVSGTPWRN